MQTKVGTSVWELGTSWTHSLLREAHLSWQFIWRDFWATIVPASLFLVAAWNSQPLSFGELLICLGRSALYFWLYIFTFCVSNQIIGLEEDRLNKPDRPLVTGAISYQGAQERWAVSMVLYSLVGWWLGVLEWTLLWQACILLHNFGFWGSRWFTKNLIMGLGTLAQLAAAWQLVTPITPIAWHWLLVTAAHVTILVHLQDLRDIEGDRTTGRNTFPIVFGETVCRIMLSLGFVLLPIVTHFLLMMPAGYTWNVILCDIGQAIISLTIAGRVIFYRYPQADHDTYMLYNYLYCFVLGSASVVL